MLTKNIAFTEEVYPSYSHTLEIEKDLYTKKNDFHEIRFFKNAAYGTVYTSDNIVQTTEKDEFVYHEMSTHVAMQTHGSVKNALIIGGGGGGCLRELLKYSSIEKVVVCEIDRDVYEGFKQYLNYSDGAFEDKRTDLKFSCGADYVANTEEKYDLIICDAPDPVGCGAKLFTDEFYKNCSKLLNKNGLVVGQIGVAFFQLENAIKVKSFLEKIFVHTKFYSAAVPVFCGGIMLFYMSSLEHLNFSMDCSQVPNNLKYFNTDIYQSCFALPNYIKSEL